MERLTINDKTFELPTSWDEFSLAQLKIIVTAFGRNLSRTDFLCEILLACLALEGDRTIGNEFQRLKELGRLKNMKEGVKEIELDIISQMLRVSEKLFGFLLDEKIILTKNHYPTLKGHRDIHLIGLKDRCTDMTYMEYATCESFLQSVRVDGNMGALDQLIGVLYRPLDPITEKRVALNDKINVQWVATIPFPIKWISTFFFEGCRNTLIDSFPHVFSSEEESNGSEQSYGHAGIMLELAGPKFGNIEQTADTPVWTIMMYLEQESIKAEKLKNEYHAK